MTRTIYEIRVDNLRSVVRERGASSVAKACGYSSPSFISQMAGKNPTRPVTEDTARKFEKGLGLPEYWLDIERDALGVPVPVKGNVFRKSPPPVESTPAIPMTMLDPARAAMCAAAISEAIAETGKKLAHDKIVKIVTLMIDDYSKEGDALREYAKTLVSLVA